MIKILRSAAGKAAERGVRVVYEFEPGFAFNKPSEIIRLADDVGQKNFSMLFDTCHAHMCATVGARQPGQWEILPGELLSFCCGCAVRSGTCI